MRNRPGALVTTVDRSGTDWKHACVCKYYAV